MRVEVRVGEAVTVVDAVNRCSRGEECEEERLGAIQQGTHNQCQRGGTFP